MNRESLIRFLQQGGLPMQGVAEEIAGQFAEKEIPKHTFFLQAGQISDEYLFLHEGCLRAFAHDTEGNEEPRIFTRRARWYSKCIPSFIVPAAGRIYKR